MKTSKTERDDDYIFDFEKRNYINGRRMDILGCKKYFNSTFERDNMSKPQITKLCKDYVDNWQQNQQKGEGMMFVGDVGTGKTFYACAIANALLEKNVSVAFTTLNNILDLIDEKKSIKQYLNCSLLVLDDFGSQRQTDYALDKVFNIADYFYRHEKPLIVTTNITPSEFKNAETMQKRRIYSRILRICGIRVKMA